MMSWLKVFSRFTSSAARPLPYSPRGYQSILSHLSFSTAATVSSPLGLAPTKPGEEKPRVVVLGTGWAGCRLMKGIDTSLYDVVCISPRNHMVFTPLLASTCVGTLEFRSVAEPVARIQPAISTVPGSYFYLARCKSIDSDSHTVFCETVTDGNGEDTLEPWSFKVAYDKLVIAAGAEALTFGIRGVKEHAIFLREVHHAQEIRRRLLLNLMLSDVPGISEEEKRRLLHCVVVGGGPTGVEFSGELSDFIIRDVRERYSHVKDYINVTLIEANEILSSFDVRLRQYATKQLTKSGVRLVRGIVKDVQPQTLILDDGTEVPYGLLGWSRDMREKTPENILFSGDTTEFNKVKENAGKMAIESLATRAFTTAELMKKLRGKNYPLDVIESVIAELKSRGFLDDGLYAESFSQSRWSALSWGPRRIRKALLQKGVNEADIERAINVVFKDDSTNSGLQVGMSKISMDRLFAQASKQWLQGKTASLANRRARMARWLQYRGFDWGVTNYILKKLESKYPP